MTYYVSYDTAKARRYHFVLDKLMSLCNTVPHKTSTFGRPIQFPLPTLYVLLVLKFDSGLGYRDFVAYLNFNPFLLHQLGLQQAPSYSTLQKSLTRLDTQRFTRMRRLLVQELPSPESMAADATGFSHTTGGEWILFRCKKTLKQRFHALHSIVDTDTLMIHASRICARPGGDAKYLVPLLKRVDCRNLDAVYADKAYISRKNVQYIADLGAYPGIEPKKNLRGKARGCLAYRQLVREYQKDPAGWKERHTYGKRSLVETVFGMMKVRFGGGLSSRGLKEQRRELLIKELVHNIERLNYLECAGR